MHDIKVRPRIREEVNMSVDEVRSKLIANEKNHQHDLVFSKKSSHCTVEIHPNNHHFWSPQATMNLEKVENGTIVRGLVGPRHTLWATFMVLYTFGIAGFIISAVIGSSMLSLNKSGVLLYISPIFLLIFIGTYVAGRIGRKIGEEQTKIIHDFVIESINS